jgi:hypothetical protein
MIADIIAFSTLHPFVAGLAIGGCGFGGLLGIIGWGIGHEHAMRNVAGWMRRPKVDEAHSDVPSQSYRIEPDNIDLTWGR